MDFLPDSNPPGPTDTPPSPLRPLRTALLAFTAAAFLLTAGGMTGTGHCAASKKKAVCAKQQHELVRRDKARKQKKITIARAGGKKRQAKTIQMVQHRPKRAVAIKEDPSHSGGLFIAPPNTPSGKITLEEFQAPVEVMANLPLGKPVPTEISSSFGVRKDPLNRKRAFHEGLDFRGKVGDPVLSTGVGTVKESGYRSDYGEYILISHGNGLDTFFAHLSERLVEAGDHIEQGERIGLVGKTGRSTGAHLHYEVRYQGKPINPMRFVQATPSKAMGKQHMAQVVKRGKKRIRR